jgi:hypothetical protein
MEGGRYGHSFNYISFFGFNSFTCMYFDREHVPDLCFLCSFIFQPTLVYPLKGLFVTVDNGGILILEACVALISSWSCITWTYVLIIFFFYFISFPFPHTLHPSYPYPPFIHTHTTAGGTTPGRSITVLPDHGISSWGCTFEIPCRYSLVLYPRRNLRIGRDKKK